MVRPKTTDPRSKQLKARFTEAELQAVNAVLTAQA